METAKEYLRDIETFRSWIRTSNEAIKQFKKDLEDINESVSGITAISYDGVSVQSSPANAQENKIIHAIDREIRIQKRIDKQLEKIDSCQAGINLRINQINSLHGMYTRILSERYVMGKTFEEIAAGIPMSYSWVTHLHGEALLIFEKKFLSKETQQEKTNKNKNFQKSM